MVMLMTYPINEINKEISIPYPLFKSIMGQYFIGQIDFLPTGLSSTTLLVALVNPSFSKVNIFVNVVTLTSMQALGFVEFYLVPNLTNGTSSTLFSCTNTGVQPPQTPKGLIQYWQPAQIPINSISIFTRLINSPGTEIVDGGQIILAPGKSLFVYMGDPQHLILPLSTRVAFGWYEEKIKDHHHKPHCE